MAKKRVRQEKHKQSLQQELEAPETHGVRTVPRSSKRQRHPQEPDAEELDTGISQKILDEARAQQAEVQSADGPLGTSQEGSYSQRTSLAQSMAPDSDDDDSDSDLSRPDSFWQDDEEEISPEDEAALQAFITPNTDANQMQTLGDIILAKIQERQQQAESIHGEPQQARALGLDDKVQQVYAGVGKVLSRFTTGKLPKAFKIIPNLTNWEEVLWLTQPEQWSPHAVFQGTRLFVSNLNARMAQRFLALVLLPHFRGDIQQNKRLHHALFQALRKATYKPDAFYKGLLLPLCASGTCTLREAIILTSAIRRTSIPALHSAAALLRLASMPYAGTTSFFIRVLLDKKYALPYRVVDGLVDHFMRFQREERDMPVVWHQSLLIFVQRYKSEIRKEDKQALRELVKEQYHYQVTPEVLRELDASRSRGEPQPADKHQPQLKLGIKSAEDIHNLAPVLMEED